MKIDAGRIEAEVPDELEDVTSYVFSEEPFDPDKGLPRDRLSVSFEPVPERVPPSEVIAYLRRTMTRAGPGGASFTEGSAKAGALDAATLKVELPGAPATLFLAVLRWPGGLVAKVHYESSRDDAAAVMARIVASIRPIGVRALPPPGFVRRRAGRLWLEMPATHAPLSSFAFSAGGGKSRLFIETEPAAPGAEPDFESLVDHGVFESIEVEPLDEGSCPLDRRPIEQRSWRADRISEQADHLGSTWFRVAWITVAEGAAARVWMIENGSPEIGDALWPEIIAGIQVSVGGP